MNSPAFDLSPPDGGHEETGFLDAWKLGVRLSGHPRWFGVGDPVEANLVKIRHKGQLQPRIKDIRQAISTIPVSSACLVSAMVGFYNPAEGARLAAKVDANGLGDIANPLNHEQRVALAQMLVNYRGW